MKSLKKGNEVKIVKKERKRKKKKLLTQDKMIQILKKY